MIFCQDRLGLLRNQYVKTIIKHLSGNKKFSASIFMIFSSEIPNLTANFFHFNATSYSSTVRDDMLIGSSSIQQANNPVNNYFSMIITKLILTVFELDDRFSSSHWIYHNYIDNNVFILYLHTPECGSCCSLSLGSLRVSKQLAF